MRNFRCLETNKYYILMFQRGNKKGILGIKVPNFYNRPDSIAEAVLMNKTGKKSINCRIWLTTRLISVQHNTDQLTVALINWLT